MSESSSLPPPARPAVVTVGDELLLGERDDGNRRWLLAQLNARGRPAEIALSLPDDVALIGYWVATLRERGCFPVLVAGGLGGTHDDCTRAGVALALGRPLQRHAECNALLAAHYGERYTAQRQRMADLPAGCGLLPNPGGAPGFEADGGYAFPGFPRMLQPMATALLDAMLADGDVPASVVRDVTLSVMEGDIALAVEAFCRDHPRARVGLYPAAGGGPPAVTLRLRAEAGDRAAQEAFGALVERLRREFEG